MTQFPVGLLPPILVWLVSVVCLVWCVCVGEVDVGLSGGGVC